MGLILDSSLLIADERGKFKMGRFLRHFPNAQPFISVFIQSFDIVQARVHARIWAGLESAGQMIGPHDLLIAAAALAHRHDLARLMSANSGVSQALM